VRLCAIQKSCTRLVRLLRKLSNTYNLLWFET
jgi:hypothetical protein